MDFSVFITDGPDNCFIYMHNTDPAEYLHCLTMVNL